MVERRKSIFRASAWERYVQAHEEAVLPRFVTGRSLALLWLLVAGLLAACALVWTLHASGEPSVATLLPWQDGSLSLRIPAPADAAIPHAPSAPDAAPSPDAAHAPDAAPSPDAAPAPDSPPAPGAPPAAGR